MALCCTPAARAADPQPYRVDMASTGDAAMDATLHATSDLISLRSSAPVSPFGLIARARGESDRLKAVLESYGHYQSTITIQVDGMGLNDPALADALIALPKDRDARIAISFMLGPLYHLRRVTIDGALPDSAQGLLALKPGAPAVAADVLGAGARLLTALQEQGYAFAKVDPPIAYEDEAAPVLDVTFHVESGPRVPLGEIRFEGLHRVHERLLRRRLLLHTGERYSPSAIERARSDLLGLGVFAAISVQVGNAVDGTGGVPITFQFRDRPRHAVSLNGAYSTDLGGSAGVTWSDRDVFGNAEQLIVAASIINLGGSATTGLGYDTSVKFIKPDFGHRDQSLQIAVGANKQFLQAYDQTAVTSGVTLTRKLSTIWTVSAGATATDEQIIQLGATHDYTLIALPLSVSYDSTDLNSPLDDPVHGMRDSISVTPTRSLGQTSATFIISQVKLATYFDLEHLFAIDPGRSVLAARALAGLAQGAGEFSLPPDQRFYGGGAGTIRGYPYLSVGPQVYQATGSTPGSSTSTLAACTAAAVGGTATSVEGTATPVGCTAVPVGGTAILAGSVEFRQRFGRVLGAALFIDGGQVSSSLKPLPREFFVGAGAGIRYYTPIGPIRLDVAVPTRIYTSGGQRFQVYIGLGQAF